MTLGAGEEVHTSVPRPHDRAETVTTIAATVVVVVVVVCAAEA